jgi:methyl-accepting chemotaxis protein
MSTADIEPEEAEIPQLAELAQTTAEGWTQLRLGGVLRVGQLVRFRPFGWTFLVTEHHEVFYRSVNQIYLQSGLILIIALAVTLALLYLFVRYLTQPLGNVVTAMRGIIGASDLSKRVELQYQDEIGDLGHTFNLMTGELEKAYNQIKSFAFRSVMAQKREQKVRNIFQKYVPEDVINQFMEKPESMLVGESRILAVMFSDIGSWSTSSRAVAASWTSISGMRSWPSTGHRSSTTTMCSRPCNPASTCSML